MVALRTTGTGMTESGSRYSASLKVRPESSGIPSTRRYSGDTEPPMTTFSCA